MVDWNELIVRCKQHAANLKYSKDQLKHLKLCDEFDQFAKKRLPECIDNPEILITNFHYQSILKILKDEYPESSKPHFLFGIYRDMIFELKQHSRRTINTDNQNAEIDLFYPDMVSCCFAQWLKTKGWNTIQIDSNALNENMQVWAELKHATLSFKSPEHIKRLYAKPLGTIVIGTKKNGDVLVDRSGLRAKIGTSVIYLIEKMNEDKHLLGCLLIAKDPQTYNYFKPYCAALEKTGIKIFWVKSATEVEEN